MAMPGLKQGVLGQGKFGQEVLIGHGSLALVGCSYSPLALLWFAVRPSLPPSKTEKT